MKKIKRLARLLVLICLIVLASIGIGMSGGIPLSSFKSREDSKKDNIELIEKEDMDSASRQSQIKG